MVAIALAIQPVEVVVKQLAHQVDVTQRVLVLAFQHVQKPVKVAEECNEKNQR